MLALLSIIMFAIAAPHVDASALSSECARCHVDEASSFAFSGHAQARTSFVFEAALTVDNPRWCVSCHAPRAAAAKSADDYEARGIGCVSCHASRAPLSDPRLCAECHQFGFMQHDVDGRALVPTDTSNARDAQQNTYAEWLAWSRPSSSSSRSERTCQSCHMKDSDHAFGGVRRIESLRNAIVVEQQERHGARSLRIRSRDVGHPLPTGDIMRFISVEAARDSSFDDAHVVARFRRDIALQRFPGEPAPRLAVVRDHRIPAEGEGHVLVDLPPQLRAWRVIYHLISEDQELREVLPPDISRIEVMRGVIE